MTELFIGSMTEADAERIRKTINPEALPGAKPAEGLRCLLHYEPGCPKCEPKKEGSV